MENLYGLVKKLQGRIKRHHTLLRGSESQTRCTLIDPLLRELGWDVEDPKVVRVEYTVTDGKVDYALMYDGKPFLFIEAKKLGDPLREKAVEQTFKYCKGTGVNYYAVTDGQNWLLYNRNKVSDENEGLFCEFDLNDSNIGKTCLHMLSLWQRSASVDDIVSGTAPLLDEKQNVSPTKPSGTPMSKPKKDLLDKDWIPLSKFTHKQGETRFQIKLPDGKVISVDTCKGVLGGVICYLVDTGHISKSRCPIPNGPKQSIVNTTNIHHGGKAFRGPVKVGDFYYESWLPCREVFKSVKKAIKHVGLDPYDFKLKR